MFIGILSQVERLREAGRLEEAAAMVLRPEAARHRRARVLMGELYRQLVDRARLRLREDDFGGAVRDCDCAMGLAAPSPDVLRLRTVARDAMLNQRARGRAAGEPAMIRPPALPVGVMGGLAAGFAGNGFVGVVRPMNRPEEQPAVPPPRVAEVSPSTMGVGAGMGAVGPFMLHVDGGGSFRVLAQAGLTVGPMGSGAEVQLAGQATAPVVRIDRVDEEYFLTSATPVTVEDATGGGRVSVTRQLLRHGQRVYLASRCGFEFVRPSPVSCTAMLLPLNSRPGQPRAVILMDGEIVIGAGPQCHVRVHDAGGQLVLFLRRGGLVLRSPTGSLVNSSGLGEAGEVARGVPVAACGVGLVVSDKQLR